MKTLKIEVSNSIYEHIMFFLESLPKHLIRISDEAKPIKYHKKSTRDAVEELLKGSSIKAFNEIKEPVEWQKSIRDEWE